MALQTGDAWPLLTVPFESTPPAARKALVDGVIGQDKYGRNALHFACQYGQYQTVRVLVEKMGANIEARSSEATPLLIAAERGHLGIVQYLVDERNASTQAKLADGSTALHLACANGHAPVVRFLMVRNLDPLQLREDECSPLILAAQAGHSEIVQFLVSMLSSRVQNLQPVLEGAFRGACLSDHPDAIAIAKYLVGAGYDPRTSKAIPPLHFAAGRPRTDLVKYLVETIGVPVDGKEARKGCTPLMAACLYKSAANVEYLLGFPTVNVNAQDNDGDAPLLMASSQPDNHQVLQLLLGRRDIDVNARSMRGATALHHAVALGDLQAVKLIAAKPGCNVNAQILTGATPLTIATDNGAEDIVRYLLVDCHADANIAAQGGATALHAACHKGYLGIAKMLVTHGKASILAKTASQMNPYLLAVAGDQVAVARYLLDECEQSGELVKYIAASLFFAATHGAEKVAKYLVEVKRVSPNLRWHDGSSPLQHAIRRKKLNIVKYFLAAPGINVNARDNAGTSALQEAQKLHDSEMVALLQAHGASE